MPVMLRLASSLAPRALRSCIPAVRHAAWGPRFVRDASTAAGSDADDSEGQFVSPDMLRDMDTPMFDRTVNAIAHSYYEDQPWQLLAPVYGRVLADVTFATSIEYVSLMAFLSGALSRLSQEDFGQFLLQFNEFAGGEGMHMDFLLRTLTCTPSLSDSDAYRALLAEVDPTRTKTLEYLRRHPQIDVLKWPLPALDPQFEQTWHRTDVVNVLEVTAFYQFARAALLQNAPADKKPSAGKMLASVMSTTMVDAMWARFFATGESEAVERVAGLCQHWAPHLEDAELSFLKPLMSSAEMEAARPRLMQLSALAATARFAMWSCATVCRQHPLALSVVEHQLKREKTRSDKQLALSKVLEAAADESIELGVYTLYTGAAGSENESGN